MAPDIPLFSHFSMARDISSLIIGGVISGELCFRYIVRHATTAIMAATDVHILNILRECHFFLSGGVIF